MSGDIYKALNFSETLLNRAKIKREFLARVLRVGTSSQNPNVEFLR